MAVQHAVERGGLRIGLLKVDRGVLAHVESAPLHHRPIAGLVDVERASRLADTGLACRHLATGGKLLGQNRGLSQTLGGQHTHRAQKQCELAHRQARQHTLTCGNVSFVGACSVRTWHRHSDSE